MAAEARDPMMAANEGVSSGYASLPAGTSLEDYVRRLGGAHVIRRVLIANNGVGAVKAIRSMRHWSYNTLGNEREVRQGCGGGSVAT